MGFAGEDAIEMKVARKSGEESIVTVNCPDKTGLGCDLRRIILESGLRITRGDVSTDGKWCFVVFWVVPRSCSTNIRWTRLKNRLQSMCPISPVPFYYELGDPRTSQVFLLKLFRIDRKGLLHDVTQILSDLDLLIHRVKVSTAPDGGSCGPLLYYG